MPTEYAFWVSSYDFPVIVANEMVYGYIQNETAFGIRAVSLETGQQIWDYYAPVIRGPGQWFDLRII